MEGIRLGPRRPDPVDELEGSARSFAESVVDGTPRFATLLALIAAGWVISRLVRWIAQRQLRRHRTESFAVVMGKVIGWSALAAIVLAAIAVTFPSVKPVDLLAGLGFFSVAVGFAFKDILENTLAGVLLLFREPFHAGDQVRVGEHAGTVVRITIRESQLMTFDGELVLIPNRDVYKGAIIVPTRGEIRRQQFVVGVAYENDAVEATEVIATALADVDGVAAEPGPTALVDQLGASTVDIVASFWADARQAEGLEVRDRAISTVKARLDTAGIEMPADIIALQATPSLRAAIHDDGEVTPAGSVRCSVSRTETGR